MNTKYEYLLHTWGGFYNEEHKIKHNCSPGYFWFDSAKARQDYLSVLQKLENDLNAHYLAFTLAEGTNTRTKTVATMDFVFAGKEYHYEYCFGYAYPEESACYMFEDGNYSCDCNRSIFINSQYPDFPEMDCGDQIEMKNFQVVLVPGTDKQFEETI